uniref:Ms(3)K81 protein n=1 Tax=Drosophila santomea TaxID=129105 RepID=Q702G4_DROSN|nr:ms(3)K81 protein [Drosophila santomea]
MSESPPHEEHRLCGLGNHTLRSPYRIIRNPHLLKFGRLINSELRSQPLCLTCYTQLIRLYRLKNNNAKRHLENRQAARALLSRSSSRTTHGSAASVSSEDHGPTTSAAAAAAHRVAPSSSDDTLFSDDDDPSSNLSLNAVNGTRLPNVQPIPKRRQFVHLNKEAMDIYLAGTTGG